MAFVLVVGAIIQCPHRGQLRLSSGDSRLTVNDKGAVTSGMEAGLTFGSPNKPVANMVAPCTAQTPAPPPPQFVPCVTSAATAGQALKMEVGKLAVLLDTAGGPTVSGQGPGKWSVSNAGQAMLESS